MSYRERLCMSDGKVGTARCAVRGHRSAMSLPTENRESESAFGPITSGQLPNRCFKFLKVHRLGQAPSNPAILHFRPSCSMPKPERASAGVWQSLRTSSMESGMNF
jgi:hypothetical protein